REGSAPAPGPRAQPHHPGCDENHLGRMVSAGSGNAFQIHLAAKRPPSFGLCLQTVTAAQRVLDAPAMTRTVPGFLLALVLLLPAVAHAQPAANERTGLAPSQPTLGADQILDYMRAVESLTTELEWET